MKVRMICSSIFLSTLSLRRATGKIWSTAFAAEFLSTLSLRRATQHESADDMFQYISIHALLAESDTHPVGVIVGVVEISIHALLAESDCYRLRHSAPHRHFYPRSPCGERRIHYDNFNLHCTISIHALLAESDSNESSEHTNNGDFYPRSPCGERHRRGIRRYLAT